MGKKEVVDSAPIPVGIKAMEELNRPAFGASCRAFPIPPAVEELAPIEEKGTMTAAPANVNTPMSAKT